MATSGRGDGETGANSITPNMSGPPVGRIGIGFAVAGCILLVVLHFVLFQWPVAVIFFLAVGLLTFVLGSLQVYAAFMVGRHHTEPLRLPDAVRDLEQYFRWLTPLAFTTGMIVAHFFWH